jgi:hypothetical protein
MDKYYFYNQKGLLKIFLKYASCVIYNYPDICYILLIQLCE